MRKYYLMSSNLITFTCLLIAFLINLIHFGPNFFSSSNKYNIVYIDVFLIIAICFALGNCYLALTGKKVPSKRGGRMSVAISTLSLGFLCLFIPTIFILFFTSIFNAMVYFFFFLILGGGIVNLVVGYMVLKSEKSERKSEEPFQ